MKTTHLCPLAALGAALSFAGIASADFIAIQALDDVYALDHVRLLADLPGYAGQRVVNVYAVFTNPNDSAPVVFGNTGIPFSVGTSDGSGFVNAAGGGDVPPVASAACTEPPLNYDSFMTIGMYSVGPAFPFLGCPPGDLNGAPAPLVLAPGTPGPGSSPWPANPAIGMNMAWSTVPVSSAPQSLAGNIPFDNGAGVFRVLLMRLVVQPSVEVSGHFGLVYYVNGVGQEISVTFTTDTCPTCTPLSAPDPFYLGNAVAVAGDTVVVGADATLFGIGSAYVYERDQGGPGAWGQVAQLGASDGTTGDYFGATVAVSGDTAIVGAWNDTNASGPSAGAAYLFARNLGGPESWGELKKLTPDPNNAGAFGTSVSIWGDTAVVGAPAAGPHFYGGAAYVYVRHLGGPDNWGLAHVIEGEAYEELGRSVSTSGDLAAVLSPGHYPNGAQFPGVVFILERAPGNPSAWSQVAVIAAPLAQAVSISGGTLAVGNNPVKIFERDHGGPNNWGQVKTISGIYTALSLAQDTLLLGKAYWGGLVGLVEIFGRDQGGPGNWGLTEAIPGSAASGVGSAFGRAVAVSCDTAVIGAAAAAYALDLPATGACVVPPANDSPASPQPVSPGSTIQASFAGATSSGTSSCDPGTVDLFYVVTIDSGPATLYLDTCGSSADTALAVFDDAMSEVGCATDCGGSPCAAPDACVDLANLDAGAYLVRVSQQVAVAPGGADSFSLAVEVDSCPADVTGDGAVSVEDLVAVILAWGTSNPAADVTGDGTVDVQDLVAIVLAWGSCT